MLLIALYLLSNTFAGDYVIIRNQCASPIEVTRKMRDEWPIETPFRYVVGSLVGSGKVTIQPNEEEIIKPSSASSLANPAEPVVCEFQIQNHDGFFKTFSRSTDMGKIFEVSESDTFKIEEANANTVIVYSKEKFDPYLQGQLEILQQQIAKTAKKIDIMRELSESTALSTHSAALDSVDGHIIKTEEAIFFVPQLVNVEGLLKLKSEMEIVYTRDMTISLTSHDDDKILRFKPRNFATYLSSIEESKVTGIEFATHSFPPGTNVEAAKEYIIKNTSFGPYERDIRIEIVCGRRVLGNYDSLPSCATFVRHAAPVAVRAPEPRDSGDGCNAPNRCSCGDCMCRASYHC